MLLLAVSISAFASSVGIPLGKTSSGIGLKLCATISGIKKYKSIIKKKKKKHDKVVLLAKSKLTIIEILISSRTDFGDASDKLNIREINNETKQTQLLDGLKCMYESTQSGWLNIEIASTFVNKN